MNNGKRRRLARAAGKVRGFAGRPHPSGNRESRRNPRAADDRRRTLADLIAELRRSMQ